MAAQVLPVPSRSVVRAYVLLLQLLLILPDVGDGEALLRQRVRLLALGRVAEAVYRLRLRLHAPAHVLVRRVDNASQTALRRRVKALQVLEGTKRLLLRRDVLDLRERRRVDEAGELGEARLLHVLQGLSLIHI